MYKLVIAAFLVACFGSPAAAQVTPDEIKELADRLANLKDPNEATTKELQDLRRQLNARLGSEAETLDAANLIIINGGGRTDLAAKVEAMRTAVEGYQDDRLATHILTLATSLETAITTYKTSTEFPENARTKLLELGQLIEEVDSHRPVTAIDGRAGRLNTLIVATSAVSSGERELASLAALRKTLITLESNHVLSALSQRIDDALSLLNIAPTDRPPLRAADITKLRALKTKIDMLLPVARKTGVHVVSARYGRVTGKGMDASCDITSAMRKKCQGEASCTLPDSGTANFCGGEDPAPFVKSSEKGVRLSYLCLTADDATWTAMVSGGMSFGGRAQTAIIRSTDDEVFCKNTK